MRHFITRTILCLGILTSFCSPPFAQDKTSAIEIEVKDSNGGLIPNAQVQISTSRKNVGNDLTAGDDGKLSVDVPMGSYDLSVTYPGFRPFAKHIEVQNDSHQSIAVVLEVGGCTQCVTVTIPTLVIQVVDPNWLPIFGVEVKVNRLSGNPQLTPNRTNKDGNAVFYAPVDGEYTVEANLTGFKNVRLKHLHLFNPSASSRTA